MKNKIDKVDRLISWFIFLVIFFPILFFIFYLFQIHKVEMLFNSVSILYSAITVILLFLTVRVYRELLEVNERTLSFTKTQTSYNFYFDNYKLFYELSTLKTDKVYDKEAFDEAFNCFDSLTFASIHFNYIRILELFPKILDVRMNYELVFNRFNYKIQSFIDILFDEIIKIKTDENLSLNQKVALINLYKNFIIHDYINLCKDLIQNKELNEHGLSPSGVPDYFKCNYNNRNIFNIEKFLKLYYEIERIIHQEDSMNNK
jgi:hypothetical protein